MTEEEAKKQDPDLQVAALARRQHGAWNRDQALVAGVSPTMIRTRRRRGTWISLDRSVYAHIASTPTWERSVMAAVLSERRAVASHRTAAVLHELEGFRRGRPEITVPPGANARSRLAIIHRGVDARTTTVRGIPTVTLDQVFVDLSKDVSRERLRKALSDRAGQVPSLLDAVRDRYCALAPRGGRDLRALRTVLTTFGAGDLPSTSELERRMRLVLDWPGIPAVEWEAPFPGQRRTGQRVDGLIRLWSMILEGDGRAWHTRVEDFENDRRRDAEAAAAGFLTLRFTWHQLTNDPDWVRRIVLETGARRATA